MNSILLFSLISFGFSWFIFLLILLFNLPYQSLITTFLLVIYMYGPFFGSLIVSKIKKENFKEKIGLKILVNRWFFISWFLFVFVVLLTILISNSFPDMKFSLKMEEFFEKYPNLLKDPSSLKMKEQLDRMPFLFLFLSFFQGLIAGITINAIASFGEESGWRGFLLNEFKEKKFIDASLRIGLIWGIWHAPLIALGHNYPEHPKIGVFLMIIFCSLLSFIFNYLRIKSKTLLSSSILHGTLNALAGIPIIYINGGNDIFKGLTGISGFLSLLVVIGIILFYDIFISRELISQSKIEKYLK